MSKKATKVLDAREILAKNIVDGISSKSISFGNAKKLVLADKSKGERFTSKKNAKGAIVNVSKVSKKSSKTDKLISRYIIEVSVPSKVEGLVSKFQISGKPARQAWKALTKAPKAPAISDEDLALANEAFGF